MRRIILAIWLALWLLAVPAASSSVPFAGQRQAPRAEPQGWSMGAASSAVAGLATWFASPADVSAAGPALRRALGPRWRGSHVLVCSGGRCVVTVLGDWCACGPRGGTPTVIDLDDDVFARLAPLSRGRIAVTVTPIPAPPPTTTAP